MATTPKTPTNRDEEAALEKALAKYKRTRIEAAQEFINSAEVAKVREMLAALLEGGLPAGSAAQGNLSQLPDFLDRASGGLAADLRALDAVIDPESATPTLPGPTPQFPAAPPVPLV